MPLWFPETAGPGNRNKMGAWGTAHRPAVPPCPIGQHLPKPYAFPVALASPERIWLDVVVRAIWRRQCAGDNVPGPAWLQGRRCFLRALDKSPDKPQEYQTTSSREPLVLPVPPGLPCAGPEARGFVPFFAGLLVQAYTVNWCIKTEDVRPAVPETMCTISSTSSHRCNGAHFKQQMKK